MNLQEQWRQQGCDACRQSALRGGGSSLVRVAVREDGPSFLHRCELCGTFWDLTIRFANPISEDEARRIYPFAFESPTGA
jgi:hypothetical protein